MLPDLLPAETSVDAAAPAPRATTPALFSRGERAERRFWEFFTAHIRNPNTRLAYLAAVRRFATWCERRDLALPEVEPMLVAAYVEQLTAVLAPASVKQHLAALRMLFDWLVVGQVVPFNPASSVRGPKHVVKTGKTPVLSPKETRALLDGIDVSTIVGLRDRAFLGVLVYSFARVSAVVALRVADYYTQGPHSFFRLHEKGGRLQRRPRPSLGTGLRRRLPRRHRHRRGSPQAPVPELRARAARFSAGPGHIASRRAQDDQAPCSPGGAPDRDLRAQLPRDRDHRVPAKRRRPQGRGLDRGPRVDPHHAALQPASRGDLARRDRAYPHLNNR